MLLCYVGRGWTKGVRASDNDEYKYSVPGSRTCSQLWTRRTQDSGVCAENPYDVLVQVPCPMSKHMNELRSTREGTFNVLSWELESYSTSRLLTK